MKIKVFYPDKDGKISFTKKELQTLLDEVYKEGYNDARPYYWQSPYWYNSGTITTTTTTPNITWSSSNSSNCIATASNENTSFTYPTAEQTLVTNGEDIPAPQEYQIKFL